jgi:nicotinamidase-related amidase
MPEVAPLPGEVVFVKRTSSAFSGTGLAAYLEGQGIADLVVVGAAVNYCVNSTLRAARDLGLRCTLVTDATFGFGVTGPDGRAHDPDTVLSVTLGGLIPEFAAGITTEALLAAL